MKLSCAIVQDLLPLYEEELCSPESREAVRAHLAQCPHCAGQTRTLEIEEFTPDNAEKAVERSFRKVRRRWVASILLVLVLLPLLGGVGYLARNEYRKEGICFSNWDEVSTAKRFAKDFAAGNYARVAAAMEYSGDYESVQAALSDTVEDNMPWVQEVQIGDDCYMVSRDLAQYAETMDTLEFWDYLWQQYTGLVWIPTDIFQQITQGRGVWQQDTWFNQWESYVSVENQWGRFMIRQTDLASFYSKRNDPVALCYSLSVYPAEMYEQTLPQIREYARSCWQSSQDWNKPYADMTLEEYTEYRRQEFMAYMQSLGVSARYKGVADAYWADGWVIAVELQFTKNGKSAVLQLDLRIRGDRVDITGGHNLSNAPAWINDVWNCLI